MRISKLKLTVYDFQFETFRGNHYVRIGIDDVYKDLNILLFNNEILTLNSFKFSLALNFLESRFCFYPVDVTFKSPKVINVK